MKKHKLLSSVLAASVLMGSISCTTEQLAGAQNAIVAGLKTFLNGLDQADQNNQAEIDLEVQDENGTPASLQSNDIQGVTIDDQTVPYTFENGKLMLTDFAVSTTVEAQVFLKGFDRPMVVVIHPSGQKRTNIKVRASVTFSMVGGRKILLDARAKAVAKNVDPLERARKESVRLAMPTDVRSALACGEVVAAWLEGDRLPVGQFVVDQGDVLLHANLFRRAFLGQQLTQETGDSQKTVSLSQSEQYTKKKQALRKRVLNNKNMYFKRRKKGSAVAKVMAQPFSTQQIISQTNIRFNLTVNVDTGLSAEQKRRLEEARRRAEAARAQAEAQTKEAQQRAEAERQKAEASRLEAEAKIKAQAEAAEKQVAEARQKAQEEINRRAEELQKEGQSVKDSLALARRENQDLAQAANAQAQALLALAQQLAIFQKEAAEARAEAAKAQAEVTKTRAEALKAVASEKTKQALLLRAQKLQQIQNRVTVTVNNTPVLKAKLASVRGAAASALVSKGAFKTRTLYLLVRCGGELKLWKVHLDGEKLRHVANTIDAHLVGAKQKAKKAQTALEAKRAELKKKKEVTQADLANLDQELASAAGEADEAVNLIQETGELAVECSVEEINSQTDTVAEVVSSADQALEVVETEEIEEELSDELEAEGELFLEETGSFDGTTEEAGLDLTTTDVTTVVQEDTTITTTVEETVVDEEAINVDAELAASEAEVTESQAASEEVALEEEFLSEEVCQGSDTSGACAG